MDTTISSDVSNVLTTEDRCDSCGAQAYVVASMASSGLTLLFCGHHWARYKSGVLPLTIDVIDETSRLVKKH
jgi:hypothetical protein